jgi:hypothetical protein
MAITEAQKPTVPERQAANNADLIARLELAKPALRNIGDGDTWPHTKLIAEAQVALAAQDRVVAALREALKAYVLNPCDDIDCLDPGCVAARAALALIEGMEQQK